MGGFQTLFSPLVKKLGYDYPKGEPIDTALLRTLAVGQAFDAGDERYGYRNRSPICINYAYGRIVLSMNSAADSRCIKKLERNLRFRPISSVSSTPL